MNKNEKTRNIRVPESLAAEAEANGKKIGWSFNRFGAEAIRVLCEMVADPSKRVVPECVQLIDRADENRRNPAPLPTSIKSRISDLLEAAAQSAQKIADSASEKLKKSADSTREELEKSADSTREELEKRAGKLEDIGKGKTNPAKDRSRKI